MSKTLAARTVALTALLAVVLVQRPSAQQSDQFVADSLANGAALEAIYRGEFDKVGIDRDSLLFHSLFQNYLEAYWRRCGASLADRVQLTRLVCSQQTVTLNWLNTPVGSNCSRYDTENTGVFADRAMRNAQIALEARTLADPVRNTARLMTQLAPNPNGESAELAAVVRVMTNDISGVVGLNACTGFGLTRFQENLRLYALGSAPVRLAPGEPEPPGVPVPPPFPVQSYPRLVDDLIAADAASWQINGYVRGSVRRVSMTATDRRDRPVRLRAEYLYVNGFGGRTAQGSLTISFLESRPECLFFFDTPNVCRPPSGTVTQAFVSGAYRPDSETSTALRADEQRRSAEAATARAGLNTSRASREREFDARGKFAAFPVVSWAAVGGPLSDDARQMERTANRARASDNSMQRRNLETGVSPYATVTGRTLVQYLERDSQRVRFQDVTDAMTFYLGFGRSPDKRVLSEQLKLSELPPPGSAPYDRYVTLIAERDHLDLQARASSLLPVVGRTVRLENGDSQFVQNYPQFPPGRSWFIASAAARRLRPSRNDRDKPRLLKGVEIFGHDSGGVLLSDIQNGEERIVDVTSDIARYNAFASRSYTDNKNRHVQVPPRASAKNYEDEARKYVHASHIDLRQMMPGLSLILDSHRDLRFDDVLAFAAFVEAEHPTFGGTHTHRGGYAGVFTTTPPRRTSERD
jgi:hypothetical protein